MVEHLGKVEIKDVAQNTTIELDGETGSINAGSTLILGAYGNGVHGHLHIRDGAGHPVFVFNGAGGALSLGYNGNDGHLHILDGAGKTVFSVNGGDAALNLGRSGNPGNLQIRDGAGHIVFNFNSSNAALYLGADGNEGDLIVRDENSKERIKLDGGQGDMWVKNSAGKSLFHFDSERAALYLGGQGNEGDLIVRDKNNKERIKLDGGQGDIKLFGADCAENFVVAGGDRVEPGTVMVIDDDETLRPSENPYDTKVAGVISGAGNLHPGIILGSEPSRDNRVPIALSGKVFCKVDAKHAPVQIGDLLTTSPTIGHAMKATDPMKSFGSIIGKALSPFSEGIGFVTMLVTLQ